MSKSTLKNNIGANIRTLRQQSLWSQSQVAKLLKISIPAYSKIETGFTDVNTSRIEALAKVFEVSVLDILLDENDRSGLFFSKEIEKMKNVMEEKDAEIIRLQSKLISLYEELENI